MFKITLCCLDIAHINYWWKIVIYTPVCVLNFQHSYYFYSYAIIAKIFCVICKFMSLAIYPWKGLLPNIIISLSSPHILTSLKRPQGKLQLGYMISLNTQWCLLICTHLFGLQVYSYIPKNVPVDITHPIRSVAIVFFWGGDWMEWTITMSNKHHTGFKKHLLFYILMKFQSYYALL